MAPRKRPAAAEAAVGPAAGPARKRARVEGPYERHRGGAIPEARATRAKAAAGFKAVCWNVAGLRGLLAKRGKDLQRLVREERPDLLGFLETKLQEGQQIEEVSHALRSLLPDYEPVASSCSKVKKGYSGVLVLARKATAGSARLSAKAVKLEKGADEGRTVCVELPNLFAVFCYVPNSGDGLVRLKERVGHWDPKLRGYLQGLAKKKPVLLLGDLNVAHRDVDIWNLEAPHVPKSAATTPEERASFGKLLDAGFVDAWAHKWPDLKGAFTYWSVRAGNRKPNRGLRLDYALVSKDVAEGGKRRAALLDAFHLPRYAPAGDHCPVGASLRLG